MENKNEYIPPLNELILPPESKEHGQIAQEVLLETEEALSQLLQNSEISEHISVGGTEKHVREKSDADHIILRAQLHLRAARQVLSKIRNKERLHPTREDHSREVYATKVIAFLEGYLNMILSIAEEMEHSRDKGDGVLLAYFLDTLKKPIL